MQVIACLLEMRLERNERKRLPLGGGRGGGGGAAASGKCHLLLALYTPNHLQASTVCAPLLLQT